MVWPVWHVCSAKADVITFLSFTAFLCSFFLCPKVLPVWPMFVGNHYMGFGTLLLLYLLWGWGPWGEL